jgi:hypothetical protein
MHVRRRYGWTAVALALPFAALLALHARHYLPFLSDDALISLRYADRLLEGRGLTWNDGERVEGYSNLLWILSVAALGRIGLELVDASRALGFVCSCAIMLAIVRTYWREQERAARWLGTIAPLLFVALAAPVAVWSIGGLEQPLYAALLAGAISLLFRVIDRPEDMRALMWLAILLGLLCLTRPDGAIFTAATAAALTAGDLRRRTPGWFRRLAIVAGVPALFYLGQLGFRVFYYGELVPNTALVKLTASKARFHDGWLYFADGFWSLSPLSFLAVASILRLLASARWVRGLALLSLCMVWSGYVVFIGGDIFPAFRHLLPLIVLFAFAVAEATVVAAERMRGQPAGIPIVCITLAVLFVPFTQTQFAHKQSQRAVRERWEWDCRDLALALKKAFHRQQPLVAVTAAGCLPYWSELPAVDMLGLNDYYLPRHPPAGVGTGFIGHELGDGKYVLERKPDLIVFNVGSRPHFRSGEELDRMPEFHRSYVPVTFAVGSLEPPPIVYVRKDSSKVGLGIVRADGTITIPALLLTGPGVTTTIDDAGNTRTVLPPGGSASLTIEDLAPTLRWTLELHSPAGADVDTDVTIEGTAATVNVGSRGSAPVRVDAIVLRGEPVQR